MIDHQEMTEETTEELMMIDNELETPNQGAIEGKMNIKALPTEAEKTTETMTKVVQIDQLISIHRDNKKATMKEETTEVISLEVGILKTETEDQWKTEKEDLSMTDGTTERIEKGSTFHRQRSFIEERKEVDPQGEVGRQKTPVAIPEMIKHTKMIGLPVKERQQKTWP